MSYGGGDAGFSISVPIGSAVVLVIVAVVLCISTAIAQGLPSYDIRATCAAEALEAKGSYFLEKSCVDLEQTSRSRLENMVVPPEILRTCEGEQENLDHPSYFLLKACIKLEIKSKRELSNGPVGKPPSEQAPGYSDANYGAIIRGYQAFMACDSPGRNWDQFLSCIRNVHPKDLDEFIGFDFGYWIFGAQTVALSQNENKPKLAKQIERESLEFYREMRSNMQSESVSFGDLCHLLGITPEDLPRLYAMYKRYNALSIVYKYASGPEALGQSSTLPSAPASKRSASGDIFSEYPAQIYHGPRKLVDLSTKEARLYRTRLLQAAQQAPNFAGHYVVAEWGCGTGCLTGAIVDLRTGKSIFLPIILGGGSTENPESDQNQQFDYRANSRLLRASGSIGAESPYRFADHYFLMRRGSLIPFDIESRRAG